MVGWQICSINGEDVRDKGINPTCETLQNSVQGLKAQDDTEDEGNELANLPAFSLEVIHRRSIGGVCDVDEHQGLLGKGSFGTGGCGGSRVAVALLQSRWSTCSV